MYNIDLTYKGVKSSPVIFYPLILMKLYKRNLGKDLNLFFPKLFSEKIQYLKLFDNKKIKTDLTDKLKVLNFLDGKVDSSHIKKVLGVYDSIDEIDISILPESFYIKTNHGCKWQKKIESKDFFVKNYDEIKKDFSLWLMLNFAYANGLELQYKNIIPKIYVEEIVTHPDYMFPIDVEIYCFDGKPRLTSVRAIKDEFCHGLTLYDMNGKILPYNFNPSSSFRKIDVVPLPNYHNQMIEIATELSQGFKIVRVDFFYTKDNFYFAEMTFTPFSGYCTPDIELENIISQWFHI